MEVPDVHLYTGFEGAPQRAESVAIAVSSRALKKGKVELVEDIK
jgi:hypothetical protein